MQQSDPEIWKAINLENDRQQNQIELIASENIVSKAVLEAQGSILTNKYAEGYCGKRYYGGCNFIDIVEGLAINRVKKLFNCSYANVQPHSGSQANQAVMMALLQPGDTILGLSLAHMGHLTHGAAPNQSGKWFKSIQYGVGTDGLIDYCQVSQLAIEHKPKLIIAGASAYPRIIDWKKFREIADSVGAFLLVDMAHYAGLIAGGVYPSPLEFAHVVTTTTHKTLRGPRGGIILSNDQELGKKINSAIFPGIQGGPLCHVIAAKAICFGEALDPSFRLYAKSVIENAKVLANELINGGLDIVTGGTDSHIVLVDLRRKGLTGNVVEKSLERAGMTCNKNAIPYDPEKPMVTSGIRLGTPAGTTRGLGVDEFKEIGQMIVQVLDGLVKYGVAGNDSVEKDVKGKIDIMCKKFPIYL
jgi:glycine hydroxymethyltransferase